MPAARGLRVKEAADYIGGNALVRGNTDPLRAGSGLQVGEALRALP